MKRALLLFLAFTAAWLAGCDKQDDGPAPELTLSGGTEKTLATGGGSESVTFTTNTTWSAEIASATPGEWCRVSPESGGAGTATVTVTAEANPDTRSRTAVLTIRAGGLTETVTFTQGEKGTVSLAQKVYQDIPAEGLSFDILFDGSLDCDQYGAKVLIEYRNWLSVEQPEEGESSYRIGVTVRPNTSSSSRSGRIAIVDKTGAGLDTVTVEQLQQNVLKWDPRRIEHDYTADVISSELQSNTEYRIEIEQQEPAWVSRIESKAASTEELRFQIGRSESSVAASCAFSSSPVRPFTVSTSRCASSASSSAVTLSSRETMCSMRGAYRRTPTKASAELAVTTMSSSMHTTAVTLCQCRRFLSSSSIGSPPSFYSSPQR